MSSMPPPQPTQPRVRTTLHPLAVVGMIGAGLMLVLLVVGIGILIAILQDSRDHIRAQDAKTAVLLSKIRAATPAARQVPPLIGEARPVVRSLGRAIGPLRKATSATATATERLPALVSVTQTLARLGVPVLSDLGRVDLARVLLAGGTVADALLYRDRLTSALDSTNRLLAEVRAQNLVTLSARAARETPALMRRLLRVQLATLASQRTSLRTQLTTLEIQRQALVSIKSIDRKTGGTVPSQGPPVPAP
jgi:hypothetical protein